MDHRVSVDINFPVKGSPRLDSVQINGVKHKIKFFKKKNVVYHAVLENGKQALLSFNVGAEEWYVREIDK